MNAPENEHEFTASIVEHVFYPAHEPRVESPTFRHTKEQGKRAGDVCAITGATQGIEYHHVFCEAALTNAVDWETVKRIGTGEIKSLPEVDPITLIPRLNTDHSPRTVPVERLLIWSLVMFAKLRGFDWSAFDPEHPETFVDSPQNMLVLHERFHRAVGHGIHHSSMPVFIFQAFPRKPGFVYMPDEMANRHQAQEARA